MCLMVSLYNFIFNNGCVLQLAGKITENSTIQSHKLERADLTHRYNYSASQSRFPERGNI